MLKNERITTPFSSGMVKMTMNPEYLVKDHVLTHLSLNTMWDLYTELFLQLTFGGFGE